MVTTSIIALGPVNMPANVIRVMRAFRVVRLFGRMKWVALPLHILHKFTVTVTCYRYNVIRVMRAFRVVRLFGRMKWVTLPLHILQ